MVATIWEVWNDRNGDLNKGADVSVRIVLFTVETGLLVLFFQKPVINSFLLSSAIFFLTFDYLIAYILIKNGTLEPPRGVKYHWWTYKAKAGVLDNFKTWRNMNPWVKLVIRVAYFTIALILFL